MVTLSRAWIVILNSVLVATLYGAESISRGDWQVSADKGELTQVLIGKTPFITRMGDFRVAGKKVRPFREVAELKEKTREQLVYEGISDDGQDLYVEFGQVLKLNDELDVLLYMEWLPPCVWPGDAVEGVIEFCPEVVALEEAGIPEGRESLPHTCDFTARLKTGTIVHIRTVGLDQTKIDIEKKGGHFRMRFQETRDYVRSPKGEKNRTLSYMISSTSSHYVRFIFSVQ